MGYYHHSHHAQSNTQEISGSDGEAGEAGETVEDGPMPPCCTEDPAAQFDRVQDMATEMEAKEALAAAGGDNTNTTKHNDAVPSPPGKEEEKSDVEEEKEDEGEAAAKKAKALKISKAESKKLSQMSLNTAVAIGLHNFPEGLATFVAALSDPKVGAVLAIAIAIHNIPEGTYTSKIDTC